MATTARQNKSTRKGAPDNSRRAWTAGARPSPTFSPASNPNRQQTPTPSAIANPSFPSLVQTNGTRPDNAQSGILQSLAGLTGTTVTVSTKTSQRYEGVVGSTSAEGDTIGVTLKDVKELTALGAPLKDQLFIAATNIESWSSGPADAKVANGDTFRTDTDISQKKAATPRERELQAWQPSDGAPTGSAGGQGDEVTFGPGANSSWDQFAVNEQLFGVKTNFDEDLYTTKLDRSAADFKERERKAQKLANEIIGSTSNNPHVAEERGIVDDSGINEEDKYGAVVRGTNAYIPPGARRGGAYAAAAAGANSSAKPDASSKQEVPKVAINGPDGSSVPASTTAAPSDSSKAASPAPASNSVNKPAADALPAFRDFVTNEKQRLTQKRQALVKSEMDKRMAELVKFSQSFKLNKPIPDDLVPILAKDEEKQRVIREKASKDAASGQARSIGPVSTNLTTARALPNAAAKAAEAQRKLAAAPSISKTPLANPSAQPSSTTQKAVTTTKPTTSTDSTKPKNVNMIIQAIPPFKGKRSTAPTPTSNGTPPVNGIGSSASTASMSPNMANRLNANASSFRPNPKASAFTPGAPSSNPSTSNQSVASASASPKPKPESASPSSNAFFGTKPIKKNTPVNIKDDFNPFKHNKVPEASQISAMWPYSGKRYMHMFPPPSHPPQQPSPMAHPVPPAMPPPPYEEDPATHAARQGGYVYAYPQYAYPGQMYQPMMAPPGPPGAYMPGPFMQPMPYPPGMPPPNAMYATPAMGQMHPHQAYMPPPPPGVYPPPPNGAQPRPSMPPTPIPGHAHPYYHQSPQLQHAVPYPVMMPPPPSVPPHPYDGSAPPPVQMGGHA
ncbi:hypothetical protein BDN72DRAFT_955246 [Pluteus cervinus]|uniref:Uncharacterized protein n=1 Tax=Pluteus cervinus TaxID=181527 RepID=A0ACD3BA89_9AGAR|nr:hypothetical protein BDN72DRAFT_955246 [Pluteus cervinus]